MGTNTHSVKNRRNSQVGAVKLREKKLANGSRSLYLDIYHKGTRSYEFLKLYLTGSKAADTETYHLAERIRTRREHELKSSEYGFVPTHLKQGDFVAYFEEMAQGKHPSWTSALQHLKGFTGGSLSFEALTQSKAEQFREYLLKRVNQNSSYLYFAKFKAAVKRALKEKRLTENPLDGVERIKMRESMRVFLTIEELRKLEKAECPSAEVKRAFLFACFTGLRFSDVNALRWEQIRGEQIELRQQKTGNPVYVPLSRQAKALLGEPDAADRIFILPAVTNINRSIVRWAQRAGITKEVSFHVSRHTFATLALTHGVDLYTVSKLLGHTDIKTTQIYAKIVDEKKREAIDRLPEL